jgi:hypothetical protein
LKRGHQVTATARKFADVANPKQQFGEAVLLRQQGSGLARRTLCQY